MIESDPEFLRIAFKSYDASMMKTIEEFRQDIRRFTFLNTASSKYTETKDQKYLRLALNHTVTIFNCFGVSGPELIKYKTKTENKATIETLMYFLKMTESSKFLDFDILNILENL